MRLFRMATVLTAGVLASCGHRDSSLEVKQFHLRSIQAEAVDVPVLRGEQQRRLFGAVSVAEREQRLGQYYTMHWRHSGAGEPVRLLFEYRQAATGRQVLRLEHREPAEATSGRAEFAVIGDDYLKRGRVLAWQATLFRGDRAVAQQRSYLWR